MIKYKILKVTDRSVTFELLNNNCYFNDEEITVLINDEVALKTTKNVNSIYGLDEDTEYRIKLESSTKNSEEIIFKTKEYKFVLDISEFGAKGNGIEDDTIYIQTAINVAPKGSLVEINKGKYNITSLFMKSGVDLYIDKDAELISVGNRENLPIFPSNIEKNEDRLYLGTWEGITRQCFAGTLNIVESSDVSVFGQGSINGMASYENWWKDFETFNIAWRPRLISILNSKNITLMDINVKNSPSWTIHPVLSKKLEFINLYVENPKDAPNTDGLDPEFCKDVLIKGVHFSVGDDCVALKSGKFDFAMETKETTENVLIENCFMEDGHGAVTMGSEMSGGIKDVTIKNCFFKGTDRGFRVKTRRGRGIRGVIENIKMKNVIMDDVDTAIALNSFYFCCDPDGKSEYVWSKEKLPIDERTPHIKSLYLEDVECRNLNACSAFIYGLPEKMVEEISLKNVKFSFREDARPAYPEMLSFQDKVSKRGIMGLNIKKLYLENVVFENIEGEHLEIENVEELIEK
ncbi:MAG: glycoside hydrolase family 28 protein [Miniphocaeibacter sp.]|uniref:glycoside hydrolase family 28 protein n=1 Tax=Miniphocaeibacter sp. TaxID=3100973 RepID=UPI00180F1AC0|nr:glycoside hydrolase family 28 protein [Gallicola sp.]